MSYPKSSTVSNGVQTDASQYNNLRLDALRSLDYLLNNSGVTVDEGSVCVFDSSADSAFKRTTLAGDPSVIGVVVSLSILAGASGYLATQGLHTVKVTGNVTRGNWLIASATAGYAKDSGTSQRPSTGAIGMATTAFTGATGTVTARLSIVPYTSNALLQQLTTVSTYVATASLTSHTFTHTVDSGTDCVVIKVTGRNTVPSSVLVNGTAATLQISQNGTYASAQIYYLKNPTVGSITITVTYASATGYVSVLMKNYIGTQATPFRTGVSAYNAGATTSTLTANSASGDKIEDALSVFGSGWVPGSGQTAEGERAVGTPTNNYMVSSSKPGAAGTTAMTWSGVSSAFAAVAAALAGS